MIPYSVGWHADLTCPVCNTLEDLRYESMPYLLLSFVLTIHFPDTDPT